MNLFLCLTGKNNMKSSDKRLVKEFLYSNIPHDFLNTIDKILFDEFIKGKCDILLKTSSIDNDSLLKIIDLTNTLYSDIDYSKNENVAYINLHKLVISIMEKYKKQ